MPMRVMQVLHQGGGAGSVMSTLHLSLGLQRAGIDVVFVCPPTSEVQALAADWRLAVRSLELRPGARRANAAALAGIVAAERPDLVNSQSARDRAGLTWLRLTGRLPMPLVLTRRQMPRTFFFENWVASCSADAVIAVSHAVARALRRRGTRARKLAVIHNGLIVEQVDRPVSDRELFDWKDRIGWMPAQRTVGIVARPKDQPVVLEALRHVRTPVRLVLAGIEPSSRVGERARAVGTPHAVVCLPFTAEVIPLYRLLDAALLPSRMEGFSQSLLEAMALGKPVIASAAGGNPELVTDGEDGLLVPPLDPRAWAAALDRVLMDTALAARLGQAARRTARERFSLDRTISRTLELYRSLVTNTALAPAAPHG
ncbi:MAG TPA: glycosyltransferase family 4 protein [Gemmatimonadales bacterium]|nr:glycosyltransferase family 4 protein [Gemmatimonadales bacterium]